MEGEFNSPERRNNLHIVKNYVLRNMASDTRSLTLLDEINTVAMHRVNKDEDDTEAVDLVLFIRNRIESIIYDE